jgi:hypothetical protein
LHRHDAGQTGGEQHDRNLAGVDVQPFTDGGQHAAESADD